MSKKIVMLFALFVSMVGMAQTGLNDYNMAIIPARFEFQKDDNQYRINTTIKAFLKQKGFEVYLTSDELPEGYMDYNCNKVFVNAIEENSMFKTAIKVEFKDCKNKVLFTTEFGESRQKEFSKAYNEALLISLKTFDKAKYKYTGKTYFDEEAQEKLKSRDVENVSKEVVKVIKSENGVTYEKVGSNEQSQAVVPFVKVIDQVTQKELELFKTSKNAVYLCSLNGKTGVVVSKNEAWFFEYVENGKVISEKLDIKL